MKNRVRAVLAAAFALAAALTVVTPAAASTQATFYRTAVPANGRVSCYGYYGTFLAGTTVVVVDWHYTSDECFGIATDRTIWHAWPNSGGWKRMGGNFHADKIETILDETVDGGKGVVVWDGTVTHHAWYQRYTPPLGWTNEWTRL